jgi:hypothetical protein
MDMRLLKKFTGKIFSPISSLHDNQKLEMEKSSGEIVR